MSWKSSILNPSISYIKHYFIWVHNNLITISMHLNILNMFIKMYIKFAKNLSSDILIEEIVFSLYLGPYGIDQSIFKWPNKFSLYCANEQTQAQKVKLMLSVTAGREERWEINAVLIHSQQIFRHLSIICIIPFFRGSSLKIWARNEKSQAGKVSRTGWS